MTEQERNVFDQGARFSRSLLAEYTRKNYSNECKTLDEKRDFMFGIWSFIEEFSNGNFILYSLIEKAFKENDVPEDYTYLFEEGISEHNRYVKYCFQHDELDTVDVHLKDYFFGRISAIPNTTYSSFGEFVDA